MISPKDKTSTAIPLPELDAYFLPKPARTPVTAKIVRTSARSWGYNLSNGKGCGGGFGSKEAAQAAGDAAAKKWNSQA